MVSAYELPHEHTNERTPFSVQVAGVTTYDWNLCVCGVGDGEGEAFEAEAPGEDVDAVPDAAVDAGEPDAEAEDEADAEGEGCSAGTDLRSRTAPHTAQTLCSVPLTPSAAASTVSQSLATCPRAGMVSV